MQRALLQSPREATQRVTHAAEDLYDGTHAWRAGVRWKYKHALMQQPQQTDRSCDASAPSSCECTVIVLSRGYHLASACKARNGAKPDTVDVIGCRAHCQMNGAQGQPDVRLASTALRLHAGCLCCPSYS